MNLVTTRRVHSPRDAIPMTWEAGVWNASALTADFDSLEVASPDPWEDEFSKQKHVSTIRHREFMAIVVHDSIL